MIANFTCVHKQNKNANKEAQTEYVFRVFDEKQTHDKPQKSKGNGISEHYKIIITKIRAQNANNSNHIRCEYG